jgi:hypothetical protein
VFRAVAFALLHLLGAGNSVFADDLLRPGDTIAGTLRFF